MEDPRPELRRPLGRAYVKRWWPGPRVGHWPDAVQMAAPVAAAALLTVCGAGLALWLSSHRAGWLGPLVFGAGVLTVGFYGWIIYAAVHPLPTARSSLPLDVEDTTELVGPGDQDQPVPERPPHDGDPPLSR